LKKQREKVLINVLCYHRVRGIGGLRVVDASVFPFVTNTNLHAPVLMLGEKAADEIFKYWNWRK